MLKKLCILFVCLLICSITIAQEPISASRVTTQQLQVTQPPLQPAAAPSATVVGAAGQTAYYYWIVARYILGNAAPSPYAVAYGPTNLSSSNYVQVTWNQVPGATGYDVLKTTSPSLPASGNILLASNVQTTSISDQGAALSAYTLNTFSPSVSMNETAAGIAGFKDTGVGGQVFNVKSYGAYGVETADDTAAVNAAIFAAQLNGGGVLFFPPGVYNLNNPNQLNPTGAISDISIQCASPTSTTINFTGSSGFLLSNDDIVEPYFGGSVEGCKFELSDAAAGTVALHLIDSAGWVIENNSFDDSNKNYNRIGIEVENATQWNERHIISANQFWGLGPSIEFICDANGTVSFGYNRISADHFQIGANSVGILVQGNGNYDGYLFSSVIDVAANFDAAGTGTVLDLTDTAGAQVDQINIQFEGGGASNSGACTDSSGAYLKESNLWIVSGAGNSPTVCPGANIYQGIVAAYGPNNASVLWYVGNGAPSFTCTNGSLYSNASGASGSTLYACIAGAWVDVK